MTKYLVRVDVGQMAPIKAKEFIKKARKTFKKAHFFGTSDKVVYVADRNGPTEILKVQD